MQRIGIVGGGKAGLRMLQILSGSSSVEMAFVVDVRPDAPAVTAARSMQVPTFTDPEQALAATSPELVFEVTGSREVADRLRALCQGRCEVVVAETAHAILDAIEESHHSLAEGVLTDVCGIKQAIDKSLQEMQQLLDTIDTITSNMQMLALNARIEAARVGEEGRGFAVVAQEMAGSTEAIRRAAQQLEKLNGSIKAVAAGLEAALTRLT